MGLLMLSWLLREINLKDPAWSGKERLICSGVDSTV
jgi:hypothetical protein